MPAARVAYVDLDPVVLSHARALLATSDGVTAVAADLRDPGAVLADPELRAVIDPARPVCVILGAVLHFMDAGAARAVTAGYARLMAPGSCLVISVASFDDEDLGKQLAAEYTAAAWHNHTPADVESFFAGLELVGPGVTEAQTWRAWMPEPVHAAPRRPCAGRRGTASSVTSSASACRVDSRSTRRRSREACTSSTMIFHVAHLTDVEDESGAAQVSAVSGTGSPVAGAAEHHAVRHALAGDAGDAAHGAGQPAVVELQGPGQVGACCRRRRGATRRPGWTVPRRRGCGGASSPAARSRRSAGAARYRPTAAGRPAGWHRCRGPGRSSTGQRARAGRRRRARRRRSGPGPRTGRPGSGRRGARPGRAVR